MSREGTRVYIGGLDDRTTKRDLEDFFRGLGPIESIWIARKPPGFGFVTFEDARDAEDACKELDGRTMNGRRVRVEVSHGGGRGRGRDEKCYECGEIGHLARDCRRRRSRSRSPRRRSRSPRRSRSRSRERYRERRSRSRSGDRGRREERGPPPAEPRAEEVPKTAEVPVAQEEAK